MPNAAKTYLKGSRRIENIGSPPIAFRWTRTSGPAITIEREGSYTDMYRYGQRLTADFDVIEINRKQQDGGAWYVLTASQNGVEIQENHELSAGHLTQSLIDNVFLINRITTETGLADGIKVLVECIRVANALKGNNWTGANAYREALDELETALGDISIVSGDFMDGLFKEIYMVGDQYLNFAYTYRHSYMIADRVWWTIDNGATFNNVGKIHTEAQMRAAETIPNGLKLPSGEWLKSAPSKQLTMGQRRSVMVEYIWANEWNRLRYDVAT